MHGAKGRVNPREPTHPARTYIQAGDVNMQWYERRRGCDPFGVVHYDSGAKQSYIWPLCSTPHLDIHWVAYRRAITCIECVGVALRIERALEND